MNLQPLENGTFSVRMTDQYGCSRESETVDVIWTGTGDQHVAAIGVFPNPMSDAARLVMSEPISKDARIEILDASGRVIRTTNGKGSRELLIERGDLESGLYLLRVLLQGVWLGSLRVVVH
jgi:hypothetical protein